MKSLIVAVLMMAAGNVWADEAYWTGKSKYTYSVTRKQITLCEYKLGRHFYWITFRGSLTFCPSRVDID